MDDFDLLNRVRRAEAHRRRAQKALENAEQKLKDAVVAAARAGIRKPVLAEVVGVQRNQIYLYLRQAEHNN